jgi:hypothetical protein
MRLLIHVSEWVRSSGLACKLFWLEIQSKPLKPKSLDCYIAKQLILNYTVLEMRVQGMSLRLYCDEAGDSFYGRRYFVYCSTLSPQVKVCSVKKTSSSDFQTSQFYLQTLNPPLLQSPPPRVF